MIALSSRFPCDYGLDVATVWIYLNNNLNVQLISYDDRELVTVMNRKLRNQSSGWSDIKRKYSRKFAPSLETLISQRDLKSHVKETEMYR